MKFQTKTMSSRNEFSEFFENDNVEKTKHGNDTTKNRLTKKEVNETSFYVRAVFSFFSVVWLLIIVFNKYYTSITAWILLIPFAIFLLGFMNAEETCDSELTEDVFTLSFSTIGVVVAIPLLGLYNKDKTNDKLNNIVFLALICTLFTYLHVWIKKSTRHVYKAVRSCLETYAVILYIFSILIFFIDEK